MAKVILEFDADEDADRIKRAINADEMASVLWQANQDFFAAKKHADAGCCFDAIDALHKVFLTNVRSLDLSVD